MQTYSIYKINVYNIVTFKVQLGTVDLPFAVTILTTKWLRFEQLPFGGAVVNSLLITSTIGFATHSLCIC